MQGGKQLKKCSAVPMRNLRSDGCKWNGADRKACIPNCPDRRTCVLNRADWKTCTRNRADLREGSQKRG